MKLGSVLILNGVIEAAAVPGNKLGKLTVDWAMMAPGVVEMRMPWTLVAATVPSLVITNVKLLHSS